MNHQATLTWQVKKKHRINKPMFFDDFSKSEKSRNLSKRTFFDVPDSSKSSGQIIIFH
jgi:hypothetical protein